MVATLTISYGPKLQLCIVADASTTPAIELSPTFRLCLIVPSAVNWTLTVTSAHDTPNPAVGANLYADGSVVPCSVTSPVTEAGISYTCTGWTGTGDVPASGSGTSTSLTIHQNSSITWNWIVTPSALPAGPWARRPEPPPFPKDLLLAIGYWLASKAED